MLNLKIKPYNRKFRFRGIQNVHACFNHEILHLTRSLLLLREIVIPIRKLKHFQMAHLQFLQNYFSCANIKILT